MIIKELTKILCFLHDNNWDNAEIILGNNELLFVNHTKKEYLSIKYEFNTLSTNNLNNIADYEEANPNILNEYYDN